MDPARARRDGRPVDGLARAGFTAKGVMYLLIGVLAGRIAVGSAGGEQADQQGAIRTVAQQPFGRALVAALALGLTAYAVWRASQAVRRAPAANSDRPAWLARSSFAVRGLLYAVTALLAWREALGVSGDGGSEQSLTTTLLAMPGGQAMVALIGLGVLAVGGVQIRQGWTAGFHDHLDLRGLDTRVRRAVDRTGRIGTVARGVVFLVAGGFLVRAALRFDADEGVGLDAALGEVRQAPYGLWLLAAAAVGLVLYGAFCLVEARYAKPARAD